jgi:hypothetical protein
MNSSENDLIFGNSLALHKELRVPMSWKENAGPKRRARHCICARSTKEAVCFETVK